MLTRTEQSAAKLAGRSIDFALQPKQSALLKLLDTNLRSVNVGFGGPRGGGKSRGIRDIMLIRRFQYPRTKGWLVRRTFDEVYENHIEKYIQERPYMREWYNTQQHEFTLPNGSTIKAKYAEHEGDLEKEYGKEAMDIFVDQAEQFTEREHNFMRTCRRSPGVPDGQCKKVDTINPGGVAMSYMKRIYIDKEFVENELPNSFAFIEASGWDNVEWCTSALAEDGFTAADYYSWSTQVRFQWFITRSQYGRDLYGLPEKDRQQQLYGDWNFFEGQVFGELGQVHNIDNYFDTSDEALWQDFHRGFKLYGRMDHASTGITAYGMIGLDVDENVLALEEYYKANCLISEHAEAIKHLKSNYHTPEYEVIDPSTEAKTLQREGHQGRHELYSVQQAYRDEGLAFVSAHRASISVGIDRIKEFLKLNKLHRNPFTQELGAPKLYISRSRNPDLWREMKELQIIKGEYVGADHALDGLRYVVMSRPKPAQQAPRDISKLPSHDQLKIRVETAFQKQWDRHQGVSKTWY